MSKIQVTHSIVASSLNDVEYGSTIKVHYDSVRSENQKHMEGKLIGLETIEKGDEKVLAGRFVREDGQECIIGSEGCLYSVGSHFELTGIIVEVEVKND